MPASLQLERDEQKAAHNPLKHRVTFPFATRVFLDPDRLELDVSRAVDTEARFKVIGMIEGKLYVVVATGRAAVCRIISARPTNRREGQANGYR